MELTPDAERFVAEWLSPSPTVHAHTSGTTGEPKPIELLKSDMTASARATIDFFGLGRDSLLLLPLSPDYIAGKMQIVRALTAGCNLMVEPPSRHPFASLRPEEIPASSMIAVVPSQVEGLMGSPIFQALGAVIIGGAPLPPDLEAAVEASGVRAYATYGMTETCSHVALRPLGSPYFRALPGFSFGTDARGCLTITSQTLSFGSLVTNDVVELSGADRFRWLGRIDNVINSGGVKIHPEEVERLILPNLPADTTAYVTSRPSDVWGEEAVIVTDNTALTLADLATPLSALPRAMRPKAVVSLPTIPRTESGKIKRVRLG